MCLHPSSSSSTLTTFSQSQWEAGFRVTVTPFLFRNTQPLPLLALSSLHQTFCHLFHLKNSFQALPSFLRQISWDSSAPPWFSLFGSLLPSPLRPSTSYALGDITLRLLSPMDTRSHWTTVIFHIFIMTFLWKSFLLTKMTALAFVFLVSLFTHS